MLTLPMSALLLCFLFYLYFRPTSQLASRPPGFFPTPRATPLLALNMFCRKLMHCIGRPNQLESVQYLIVISFKIRNLKLFSFKNRIRPLLFLLTAGINIFRQIVWQSFTIFRVHCSRSDEQSLYYVPHWSL